MLVMGLPLWDSCGLPGAAPGSRTSAIVVAAQLRARGSGQVGPEQAAIAARAGLQGSDRVREQAALMSVMPKGAGRGRSNSSWSEQTLNALLEGTDLQPTKD